MKKTLAMLLLATTCATTAAAVTVYAWQSLPNDRYSRREADIIGQRLFKAIIGRAGNGNDVSDAATQVMLGKMDAQVEAMFNSGEFRQKASGMKPNQILDQIYQGLLDRPADGAGVRTYLRDVEGRRYASVVLKIINDTEFETKILGRRNRPPSNPRGTGPLPLPMPDRPRYDEADLMRSAEACQMAVLDEMYRDYGGPLLIEFQGMNRTSSLWGDDTIRGNGVETFDRSRRFSYRCEMERGRFRPTRVTYDFDSRFDRRNDRRDDYDFPLRNVRSCQDAVRDRMARDRRRDVTFETAGVSEWDRDLDRVYGRGRERGSSYLFSYRCDVERGRVTTVDFSPIR